MAPLMPVSSCDVANARLMEERNRGKVVYKPRRFNSDLARSAVSGDDPTDNSQAILAKKPRCWHRGFQFVVSPGRLSLRLRLHSARVRLRAAALAGCGNGGGRPWRLVVLGGEFAHRRLAVQEIVDFLAGQGLIFEQPLGDDVQFLQ